MNVGDAGGVSQSVSQSVSRRGETGEWRGGGTDWRKRPVSAGRAQAGSRRGGQLSLPRVRSGGRARTRARGGGTDVGLGRRRRRRLRRGRARRARGRAPSLRLLLLLEGEGGGVDGRVGAGGKGRNTHAAKGGGVREASRSVARARGQGSPSGWGGVNLASIFAPPLSWPSCNLERELPTSTGHRLGRRRPNQPAPLPRSSRPTSPSWVFGGLATGSVAAFQRPTDAQGESSARPLRSLFLLTPNPSPA